MKASALIGTCCSLLAAAITISSAAVLHVDGSSTNPVPPYASWTTAANVIQAAVDAAAPGDEVLVTNGVYQTGGRADPSILTNRVTVTLPIVLRSVNGPEHTFIIGNQMPGEIYGPEAVRGVFLANGATLIGFTVSHGATRGQWEYELYQDTVGGGINCASASEVVSNCVVVGNHAGNGGGGIFQGTIYDSIISGNEAYRGAGVIYSVLHRSQLLTNSANSFGYYSGGGAESSDLSNCLVQGNDANLGGGLYLCTARNTVIIQNLARYSGGGASGCTLTNCTLTGNVAQSAGGVAESSLFNSIVYYNRADTDADHHLSAFYFCNVPAPLPPGSNNIITPPQLADLWHLTGASPARAAGNAAFTSGIDYDGEAWAAPPAIGADEFVSGAITGALSGAITADYTNVASQFPVNFTSFISGHAASNRWDFGDDTMANNQPIASHSWAAPGSYPVTLTVFNESFPAGISATLTISVSDTPRYVALHNPNPAWPYNSWATAATNIQDAVDTAFAGGLVLVSNGVYEVGGRATVETPTLTNRVVLAFPLTLQSVNGPATTVIKGYQMPGTTNGLEAIRCIYLAADTKLFGFTLTNGATLNSTFNPPWVYGAGAYCATPSVLISNCVFRNNSCPDSGGGVNSGTVVNSNFSGNTAIYGGAAANATLTGCTIVNNRAYYGGGVRSGTLTSCVLSNNVANSEGGGVHTATLSDCQLLNNAARQGGGAYSSTLTDCTLRGNSAFNAPFGSHGGGASYSTLTNCTIAANTAASDAGVYGSDVWHSTLTNNVASQGGGAGHANFHSCLIRSNSASYYGGVSGGSLNNCLVIGNRATSFYGGGAGNCTISNSTIVGNSAVSYGGGVIYYGTVYNSIVYNNSAATGPNYHGPIGAEVVFHYSCTTPLPTTGTNNIAATPLFVNAASGDFRLTPNSPGLNAGNNDFAPGATDFAGAARISGGIVDLGAYEYSPPPPPPPAAPFAFTSEPTEIHATTAQANGFATPNGLDTLAWFEWGLRGSYTQSTSPTPAGNTFSVQHVAVSLTNLTAQTAYQYRLVVSNALGLAYGSKHFFATGARLRVWGDNSYGQTNMPAGLSNIVMVAAANLHSLALRTDGTVIAWGSNSRNQTNVPAGLSNVVTIAARSDHNLALKSDGSVVAWGSYQNGSVPVFVPTGLTNIVSLAAGRSHSAALKTDGTVTAWGLNSSYGLTNVPIGLSNVVDLISGEEVIIAIRNNGTLVAWGNSDSGRTNIPAGLTNAVAASASFFSAWALTTDSVLVPWGYNVSEAWYNNFPIGVTNFIDVSAGNYHTLALTDDGVVFGWGYDISGQLIAGVPTGISNVTSIAAGDSHNVVLLDNTPPLAIAQTLTGPANQDLVIPLKGSDVNIDLLNYRITTLPTAGALYQYVAGTRGNSIVSPNTSVSDPLGRVIFAPAPDAFGSAYASLEFVANDGSADSGPAVATINIEGRPYAHTLVPTELTPTRARFIGSAVPNNFDSTAWFEWGEPSYFTNATTPVAIGSGAVVVPVSVVVSNLPGSGTLECRLVVSNAAGVTFGFPQLFAASQRVKVWGNYNGEGQTNVPANLGNIISVKAASHTLVLKANGTAVAWGFNNEGQTVLPAGLSNLVAVAAGNWFSLALKSDATVATWGYYQSPVGLSNVINVAAGPTLAFAVDTTGKATVWGSSDPVLSTLPSGLTNIVSMAAGWYHGIALKANGTVGLWGYNNYGQTNLPATVTNCVAVAAGDYHNLALLRNGTVIAWGDNSDGQTTPPPALTNVVAIAARGDQSFALRHDGTLVAWGANNYGQLTPPPSLTRFTAIAPGYGHTAALIPNTAPVATPQLLTANGNTDLTIQLATSDAENDPVVLRIKSLPAAGALYQYSNGARGTLITTNDTGITDSAGRVIFVPATGELGLPYAIFSYAASDGDAESTATITINEIGPLFTVTRPAVAIRRDTANLTGFVAPNGFATTAWFEWGTNSSYGQSTSLLDAGAGNGLVHLTQELTELIAGQAIHFRLVASNASQTVSGMEQQFVTSGKVFAWGDNSSGQSAVPTNIGALVSVAGGLAHSIALRADGTIAAWGNNAHGQTNVSALLTGVSAIAAGGFHNLALLTNGTVTAWGRNNLGQTNIPVSALNVAAIAAGGQHSIALRGDGSVVAWGDNSQGQRTVPATLTNAVAIAAGWYHNVALRADGSVMAWGANTYGQSSVPAGLSNVVWVSAGLYHSLALRGDGSLVAWGLNTSGQTTVPATATNLIAVAAGGSHNLAQQSDGNMLGWGYNFFGQATPTNLSPVVNFAAGSSHSLALVPNQLPVAQPQTVATYPNSDIVITLAGTDADDDVLSYRLDTLPGTGTAYQFANGVRGVPITLPHTSISDAQGRLIFAPAANAVGSPHANFDFVALDGYAPSFPASVTIHVVLPAAPTFDLATSGMTTNGGFQLGLTGATNATYRVWASTNLVNWELLGPTSSPAPGQFLFLDSTATNWPQRFYRATAP
jgi:alpha-tubulin suppressor-like RCC1 family protein